MRERVSRRELARREVVLESCRGLVLKLSWESWKRLPRATQIWVDPEDLIEEAYVYVLYSGLRRYNGRAGYTTFLWHGVSHLLANFAKKHAAKKRFGYRLDLEEICGLRTTEWAFARIEAEEAVRKLYGVASPELRGQMRNWFSARERLQRAGREFQKSRKEFLWLARRYRVTYGDCSLLMSAGFAL